MTEFWREHWVGMPEYRSENCRPFYALRVMLLKQNPPACKSKTKDFVSFVTVQFREENLSQNMAEVANRLGVLFSVKTKQVTLDTDEKGLEKLLFPNGEGKIGHHATWFPWKPNDPHSKYEYRGGPNPIYPVYVITKGRWKAPLTARALERMGVPYTIVVEPKEHDAYKDSFAKGYDGGKPYLGTILPAPENFSERGDGSIPVRNFVWGLAIGTGAERHWLMDDNIPTFNRMNYINGANLGIRCVGGGVFRAIESFADRYENVAITGMQNSQFAVAKQGPWPAFFLNTRVYSCTLIKNDLVLPAGRWRGRYNEDTDLCIRALKSGWCTVLFVTFNADKVGTMEMTGGNTDVLYAGDGRLKMAQSLYEQHPDVVRVGERWNRAQHVVNYPACVAIGKVVSKKKDSGELKPKKGVVIPEGVDNFGMVLYDRESGEMVNDTSDGSQSDRKGA